MEITDNPLRDRMNYELEQEANQARHEQALNDQLDYMIGDWRIKGSLMKMPEYPYVYVMLTEFAGDMQESDLKAVSECLSHKDGQAYVKDETELGRVVGEFLVEWLNDTAESNCET